MGFSDAGIYLTDQNNLSETELGFLHEPSLGFSDRSVHASPQRGGLHAIFPRYQELADRDLETSNFSSEQGEIVDKAEEDCCKTPTRPDQILPAIAKICPPAPRKPRAVLSRSFKVRNPYRSRRIMLLDVSKQIECLIYPTSSLGNKIKKAKHT